MFGNRGLTVYYNPTCAARRTKPSLCVWDVSGEICELLAGGRGAGGGREGGAGKGDLGSCFPPRSLLQCFTSSPVTQAPANKRRGHRAAGALGLGRSLPRRGPAHRASSTPAVTVTSAQSSPTSPQQHLNEQTEPTVTSRGKETGQSFSSTISLVSR